MSTDFFIKSKEITDGFLQSIVFLDDKAFEKEEKTTPINKNHPFDSFEVSKVFAEKKKICAVYCPVNTDDINNFKEISKKADVVILDWYIDISDSKEDEDLTKDAEVEDPRGQHTMNIISELTNNSGNDGLKLILIYTGENGLEDIANDIYKNLQPNNQQLELKSDNCEIFSTKIRILVRAKYNGDSVSDTDRIKKNSVLKDKILQYKDLPDFVLNELTIMTSGILSNFALLSLTAIRNNSHKILSLFSKELDASYLGHKVLLPIKNDSEELLLKLFGDTISDLLQYASIPNQIRENFIDSWIDNNIKDEEFILQNKKFQRTKDLLIGLLASDKENIDERFNNTFDQIIGNGILSGNEKKIYRSSKSTELFLNIEEHSKKDDLDTKFATLTHHKSLFIPKNTPPKLTLGSVIRGLTTGNYYVCIQQRCDSVRIGKDKERKFLFLPIEKAKDGDKFHIITPEGHRLKLENNSYSIKTIKFKCNCDEGEVKGESDDNDKYVFKQSYEDSENYEWVFDLKDLHSQRIVENYVKNLSRIGLDESEWLRKAGEKNK